MGSVRGLLPTEGQPPAACAPSATSSTVAPLWRCCGLRRTCHNGRGVGKINRVQSPTGLVVESFDCLLVTPTVVLHVSAVVLMEDLGLVLKLTVDKDADVPWLKIHFSHGL